MRAVLQAISDELLRLKAEGETSVPVTEETLIGLRALVKARAGARGRTATLEPAGSVGPAPAAAVSARVAIAPATMAPVAKAPVVALKVAAPAVALPPPPVLRLPEGEKAARWAALNDLLAQDAVVRSHLRGGKRIAFGAGPLEAKLLFVGDAPGPEEETSGEPFVGPAGALLTKMIGGMGLRREQVMILNLVVWRPLPPGAEGDAPDLNRTATREEMAYCLPYVQAAAEIVNPDLIVALGGTAAQGMLGKGFTTLPEVRGRWLEFGGRPLMVTYHPNYLLKSATNRSKRAVWEDLLRVMERAGLPISEKQRGYFL